MATPCVCLKETWPQEEVGPAPKRSDSAMRRFSGRSPPPSPAPPGRAVSLGLRATREEPGQTRVHHVSLHPRGEEWPRASIPGERASLAPHRTTLSFPVGGPCVGTLPATDQHGPRAAGAWARPPPSPLRPTRGLDVPTLLTPALSRPAVLLQEGPWRRQPGRTADESLGSRVYPRCGQGG